MSKGFASNYRIFMIAAGLLFCFGGIGTRLVFLHIIDRGKLLGYVEKVRRQVIVEHARRGAIYDRHGYLLATNQSKYMVGADPQVLRDEDKKNWVELATLIGIPLRDLEPLLNTKYRGAAHAQSVTTAKKNSDSIPTITLDGEDVVEAPRGRPIRWVKLRGDVDEVTYEKINKLEIKGVYGNRIFRRVYPHNELASHLVGYVNKAGNAAAGVENYADFYLRGQDGWREGERDGKRRELAQFRTRQVEPVNGYNVVLSTDIIIQHMVEEELDRIVADFKPEKATIIVSDAKTGFILAMGNYPNFDLNKYYDPKLAPLSAQRNFAITDQFDPGSTFKIVAASGALNDNLVNPNTHFDCSLESVEYQGRMRKFMPDDHKYDHPLSVAEIISRSSNIGAAQLGMKLGEERLYAYARSFGFGEKSGFPFGGEITGLLNPVRKWSGIDITRIPAGYSIAATPLQIHYAMGVIASGGELLKPQLIKEIKDDSGEIVFLFDKKSRRRVVSEPVAHSMAKMLQGVTQPGGTAVKAAIPGYEVAGKTGTAQKLINGRYSKRHHVGSFVGFFPASRPEVVISVIVDDGKPEQGLAYGSVVGVQYFKRLGEQLIQYLDIKPPYETGRNLVALNGGRQ